MKFSFIGAFTPRTLLYLNCLLESSFTPSKIVLLSKNVEAEDFVMPNSTNFGSLKYGQVGIRQLSALFGCDVIEIVAESINSNDVTEELVSDTDSFVIFSGYPGDIISGNVIDVCPPFLHVHPGKLPSFRGSTTFYYQLIEVGYLTCSSIILAKKIDGGPLIYSRDFNLDDPYWSYLKNFNFDFELDPFIRFITLRETLEMIRDNGLSVIVRPHCVEPDRIFYVAHPMLRALARRLL